jgi:hypothetical protein
MALGTDVVVSVWVGQGPGNPNLNLRSAVLNGGQGLAITDLNTLIGNVAMTRRRVTVTSPWADGNVQIWSVRDKEAITMTVACLAYDHTTLQGLIADVIGAFDRPNYDLSLNLDGVQYAWNCDNADWSIDMNQPFWHFYSAYIKLSIPRNPVPLVGPV